MPIPTRPLLLMIKKVADDEPTTNAGAPFRRPFGLMERRPHGDVVPTPTPPTLLIVKNVEVANEAVDELTANSVEVNPLLVVVDV